MKSLLTEGGVEIATLPGKCILELNRYTVRRSVAEAEAPAILALECRKGFDFGRWSQEIPSRLWDRAVRGEMQVVFDATAEGALHRREETSALHGFLSDKGVALSQAVYLTQDRGWESDYATAWALAPGERMRVLYADYWVRRFFMSLEKTGPALFEARHARFLARSTPRERRLITLNLTPRESKVLFLLRLMRDGAWDQAFVSFGGFGQNRRGKQVHVRTWADEFASLAEQEERLASLGRFILGEDGDNTSPTYATPVHDVDLPEHDRSWFTVVPETEMRDRVSRITEKPCKPLVSFHPLIFLGNPGALGHLRELGFQTFEGFFDERYDEEPDPRRRFDMVYDQVLALVRADEADLARRSALIAERVVHNARFGLTALPRLFRKKRDYALLKDILQG